MVLVYEGNFMSQSSTEYANLIDLLVVSPTIYALVAIFSC